MSTVYQSFKQSAWMLLVPTRCTCLILLTYSIQAELQSVCRRILTADNKSYYTVFTFGWNAGAVNWWCKRNSSKMILLNHKKTTCKRVGWLWNMYFHSCVACQIYGGKRSIWPSHSLWSMELAIAASHMCADFHVCRSNGDPDVHLGGAAEPCGHAHIWWWDDMKRCTEADIMVQ